MNTGVRHSHRTERVVQCSALLCACALAAAAHAETSPYTLGAGITYGRDDNLFRAPAGQEVSDRYTTVSLFGGVDQTISRQRVRANATVRRSDYRERTDLNNTGYGVLLGWNGETEGEVSWNMSYTRNRSLASYATVLEAAGRIPNIETSQQASAGIQLGLQAEWVANLTLSHRSIDYTAPAYADDQYRLDTVAVGPTWNPPAPGSI